MFSRIHFLFFFAMICCCAMNASAGVSGGDATSYSATQLLENSGNGSLSRNSVVMTPATSEGLVDSNYKLGPGDYLDIVLEDTYLSVQVYPDGSIIINECGSVNVAGKTVAEARDAILQIVAKRYNPKYCFVQLAQMKKFKVNVMGAVRNVGQFVVDPQTRLSYLMRLIGGTLPGNARDDSVLVIRKTDTLRVNYTKISNEGDFKNDIVLEQGDLIYVPFADMNDAVTLILPGYRVALPYLKDGTVADYFKYGGGDRYPNLGYNSVTIRDKSGKTKTISISEQTKTVVDPGSELEFSTKTLMVYVGGAVAGVGRVGYDPSWHALDYIAAAGVTTITGSWDQVKVIRGNRETIMVNATQDPIFPGDYIEIPKSAYERFKDFTLFIASLLTVVSSAFIIYVNYK